MSIKLKKEEKKKKKKKKKKGKKEKRKKLTIKPQRPPNKPTLFVINNLSYVLKERGYKLERDTGLEEGFIDDKLLCD